MVVFTHGHTVSLTTTKENIMGTYVQITHTSDALTVHVTDTMSGASMKHEYPPGSIYEVHTDRKVSGEESFDISARPDSGRFTKLTVEGVGA